jgi:hypothetical protein
VGQIVPERLPGFFVPTWGAGGTIKPLRVHEDHLRRAGKVYILIAFSFQLRFSVLETA